MSHKVIALLNKYGPMLSGELARHFQNNYKVSNEAARQALSRAGKPVNKICTISFDKNQKFFYLEGQFMSEQYIDRLIKAIKAHSQTNFAYITAFIAQNGYISKDMLPALVSSPIKNVRGHKLHQRVIDDLLKCRIIQEFDETRWMLAPWVVSHYATNLARSTGLEVAKKQLVHDFANWAAKLNLVGFSSWKTLNDTAEFANFQWAFSAPSYVQPLYDTKRKKPGFIVADVFYGKTATVDDIRFFLDKISIIRTFRNLPTFLPVLLVEQATSEALSLLKDNKITIAFISNLFDERYTELLNDIVNIFANSTAFVAQNPAKIENLFSEIAKSEGRYNDIVGDLFELLVGYYYQQIGVQSLYLKKLIQIPESANSRELDVLVEREGKIIVAECKATRSMLGVQFVEKWLNTLVPQIRKWLLFRYPDKKDFVFQLWSLGGFTEEALQLLTTQQKQLSKYQIHFFNKQEILNMAREKNVQPVIDVIQQYFPDRYS